MLVTAKASKVVLADVLELLGSLKLIKHDKNTGSSSNQNLENRGYNFRTMARLHKTIGA
jgi:hypothetical protein